MKRVRLWCRKQKTRWHLSFVGITNRHCCSQFESYQDIHSFFYLIYNGTVLVDGLAADGAAHTQTYVKLKLVCL